MSAQLTLGFWRGRIQNRDPILRWSWLCFTRDSRLVPAQMSTRRFTPTSSWSPLITSHDKARVNTSAGEAVNTTDRRTVDFHPSVWGDYFIEYTSSRDKIADGKALERIQELTSEVKRMLATDAYSDQPSEILNLIDGIQRLGISYKFDREIKEYLAHIYLRFFKNGCPEIHDDDLHTTALQFRLLRQHGYRIPSSVFDKFKDHEGKFHVSLTKDVKGLLSLYEASHLRVRGEETLEEALSFCTSHLRSIEDKSSDVSHALRQCLHRAMPRLEARRYMEINRNDDSRCEVLLDLARLDFNWTQRQHQTEVPEITRWWKDLDFRGKLPFARDRVVECYFWILGVYFEPEHSLARNFLTKVLAMISIIDDIYDVYGTAEELELFTEAIERWEADALDALPGYMQVCYSALLRVYREMEAALAANGRSYYIYYAIEAMKIMVRGYFEESKWLHRQHVPTVEEYMDVVRVTAGYRTLTITSIIGMADVTPKDVFEWLLSDPTIVKSSGTAWRLMDDIASHRFEQERGHIASAVECYMKQHGVEEQEAEDELKKRADGA